MKRPCTAPTVLLLLALLCASQPRGEARTPKRKPIRVKSVDSCVLSSPASGANVAAGASLTVSASAGGTISRVDIFISASSSSSGCKLQEIPSASASGGLYSTSIQIPTQSTGTLYLYAKCVSTLSTDPLIKSAYVAITVTGGTGGNIPPFIRLTSPLTTQTFTAPATITAAAAACDLDGTIAKVDFLNSTAKFATATNVPLVGALYVNTAQTISFYGVAYDNTGATTTSAPLIITVGANNSTGGGSGGGGSGGSSSFSLTVVNGPSGQSGTKPMYTWINITANDPPAGQVFAGWQTSCAGPCPQLQWSDPENYRAQIYSRSGGTVTLTATYKVDSLIPNPVPTHPRLLITAANIPMLQSWANPANPMYVNGFKPALNYALGHANSAWSWSFNGGSGTPNLAIWKDTGGDSWEGDHTEAYAMFFAFSALIHSDITHANRAKDLFMWVIRTADVNGPTGDANLPFGSKFFSTYNRASHYGDGFGTVYDWLQWPGFGPSLFTASEKAQVRRVFLMWGMQNIAGYMAPPAGVLNNPAMLLPAARGIVNNYASAHMRQLAYFGLSIDAADDPALDSKLPEAYLGNTVRSFIKNVAGGWLYNKYAVMESPATVAADYGIPITSPNLGSMSGGLSPEGFLYGSSMAYVMQTLAALHTSGWGTVAALGPQMKLINSTWWDKYLTGFMTSLTPAPFNATGSMAYMGQVWQMHNYGDSLRLYIDPPQFDTFGILGWFDKSVGNSRFRTSQWIGANVMLGGPQQLYQRASNIWGNCYARGGILHFLLYEPSYGGLADPRPALPTTFIDPSLGRVVAKTSWVPSATSMAYKCSWENVNHMLADCGQFELFRKGEFLTKENTGYATDASEVIGGSSVLHNTLTIKNTVTDPTLPMPIAMQPDEQALFSLGSQQAEGYANGGDPNTTIADFPQYMSIHSSFAGLYNRPSPFNPGNAAVDVLHASRTLLWLKSEEAMIMYDRATTIHFGSGKFKRFNMNFIVPPQVAGNVVTQTTTVNRLQVTTLLPAGANLNLTVQPIPNWHNPADFEPSRFYMSVEDPSCPADVRFLHVLQASDTSAPAPTPAVLLTGSVNGGASGTAQGALVGSRFAAIFKNDATPSAPPVTSVSFSLPAGADAPAKVIVTGLVPGSAYSISSPAPGSYQVTQGGADAIADASGAAVF